jgi:MerR family transcriptional regulator, copper efflux regulator
MNIGQAAAASSVSAKMIRYYEAIGLIQPVDRTDAGYRVYGADDIHTLRFIKRARTLGFSVDETMSLLALWRDKSRASGDVKTFALTHIRELEGKIKELQSMVRTLRHLAGSCHGDNRPECPILEDLADPQERARPADAVAKAMPVRRTIGGGNCRSPEPILQPRSIKLR